MKSDSGKLERKKRKGIASAIITTIIIMAIIFSGPASAVNLLVLTDEATYTSAHDAAVFTVSVEIESEELVPVQNLTLTITDSGDNPVETCVFSPNGEFIGAHGNITDVTPLAVGTGYYGSEYGYGYGYQDYGYGYGYGYDVGYGNVYFGYGYGYGYNETYPTLLKYNVTWNFTAANPANGNYNATLSAYAAGEGGTHTFVSDPAPFTMARVAPYLVSYTISNRTITPPQTTSIDVEFSEEVAARIKIEDSNRILVKQLYYNAGVTDPQAKIWNGTYTNNTRVPDGDYYVNVTGLNTTTGLGVINNTQTITVTSVGEPNIEVKAIHPGYVFANMTNVLTAYVNNTGNASATNFNVSISITNATGEGLYGNTTSVALLNASELKEVNLGNWKPTVLENITINVTADCDNTTAESDETDNSKLENRNTTGNITVDKMLPSTCFGYRGQHPLTEAYVGGSDVIYTVGDYKYQNTTVNFTIGAGGDDNRVYNATADIPAGATIEQATLYLYHNWRKLDTYGYPDWTMNFTNSTGTYTVSEAVNYTDCKGFGTAYMRERIYGTIVYDVTNYVTGNDTYTANVTGNIYPINSTKDYGYASGMALMVVYNDSSSKLYRIAHGHDRIVTLYQSSATSASSYHVLPDNITTSATLTDATPSVGVVTNASLFTATVDGVDYSTGNPAGESLKCNDCNWYEGAWSNEGMGDFNYPIGFNRSNVTDCLSGAGSTEIVQFQERDTSYKNGYSVVLTMLVVEYREPSYNVSITATPTSRITTKNINATYTILVTNAGDTTDSYTLSVTNTDGAAVANLSAESITNLAAGATGTVLLNVTDDDTLRTYSVTVNATSAGNTSKTDSVTMLTTVAPSISIGDVSVAPSGTTTAPIMIRYIDNVSVVHVNVTYDPSVVRVISATDTPFDLTTNNLVYNASGYVEISGMQIATLTGLNSPITLSTLTFEAVGSEGASTPVNLTLMSMATVADGVTTPITTIYLGNGTFRILDLTNPVINSVALNRTEVYAGEPIHVTVNATDNVGVTSVTAAGGATTASLSRTSADIWEGDITAKSAGTHTVTVTAYDAEGLSATNATQYYVTLIPLPAGVTEMANETLTVVGNAVTFIDATVSATIEGITFTTGTGSVTARTYTANPTGVRTTGVFDTGFGYFSIDVDPSLNAAATITFKVPLASITAAGLTTGDITLYQFSGGAWNAITATYIDTVGTDARYSATVSHFSVFAIGGTAAAVVTPPTGGGGGAYQPPIVVIPHVDSTGAVTSTTTLTKEKATLTIPVGTIVKDAAGNPLSTSITMVYTKTTADSIGAITAYDLGPSGTTFAPAIDLAISYDTADIPAGMSESDLLIRMYDGTKWVDLVTTVDTTAHIATAKVSHFTIFALFAAVPKEVPTPPITPTPLPTVAPTITPPVEEVKRPWGLIIGIIIAVVIVGAAAYYYYYTKKKA